MSKRQDVFAQFFISLVYMLEILKARRFRKKEAARLGFFTKERKARIIKQYDALWC
jgi:hypothetical protein